MTPRRPRSRPSMPDTQKPKTEAKLTDSGNTKKLRTKTPEVGWLPNKSRIIGMQQNCPNEETKGCIRRSTEEADVTRQRP